MTMMSKSYLMLDFAGCGAAVGCGFAAELVRCIARDASDVFAGRDGAGACAGVLDAAGAGAFATDAAPPDGLKFFLTSAAFSLLVAMTPMTAPTATFPPSGTAITASVPDSRSEERRVGQEC